MAFVVALILTGYKVMVTNQRKVSFNIKEYKHEIFVMPFLWMLAICCCEDHGNIIEAWYIIGGRKPTPSPRINGDFNCYQ
jgi:hypothetical protein